MGVRIVARPFWVTTGLIPMGTELRESAGLTQIDYAAGRDRLTVAPEPG
jgi:hypothetical protein